jgi:phosphoenolpyruvate carboxylase
MEQSSNKALQQFKNYVGIKFQLYNSLFTALPFHRIEKTGILLSLLSNICEEGFKNKLSPVQVIEEFFNKHTFYNSESDQLDLLFRFVQYVERQVVLFDALEDAAFREVNDLNGVGTLKHLESEVIQTNYEHKLSDKMKDFAVRLVLTAHPTQFYPGTVLGIINDLSKALLDNNASQVNTYLQQLGKTPFFKKQKPTPHDEAVSLIWYLENVFYPAAGKIAALMKSYFPKAVNPNNPVIHMGFWPGGDRDGNPYVTAETTLQVADALRGAIIKCYYLDIRRLKRRLTFEGVDTLIAELENKLYNNLFIPGKKTNILKKEILQTLENVKDIIIKRHDGLFLHLVNNLINKVEIFGFHFASLDIRQDSSVHRKLFAAIAETKSVLPENYFELSKEEKVRLLVSINKEIDPELLKDPVHRDTLKTINTIRQIQQYNGMEGCHRYIISHCTSALDAIETYGLFLLCGWKKEEINIDIIPLFETIEDLQHASSVMKLLYSNSVYKKHLTRMSNRQTIMLGFSDGTKDGGYLMANWSIYKAKEELTRVSKDCGVDVVFFDGRGGPPARGGGKTHKFYASMGRDISNKEIQLTIQGQTVSSNFGTIDSAQFNIEQLIHAGISNDLFPERHITMNEKEQMLLEQLANYSYESYKKLKYNSHFLDYLLHLSPLKFYSDTNIGSRPAKRGAASRISLNDLRAIPFVGSWSQLKQNVTGYFGVGAALQQMEQESKFADLKKLYKESLFFKTLLDNCEMSMVKSFFPLTAFLSDHPQFGEIWQMIYKEYELTKKYISLLSERTELMEDYPVDQLSIQMREKIVLPLVTIQQYAITKVRQLEELQEQSSVKPKYEKLVMRCSFGIINAGRNSA